MSALHHLLDHSLLVLVAQPQHKLGSSSRYDIYFLQLIQQLLVGRLFRKCSLEPRLKSVQLRISIKNSAVSNDDLLVASDRRGIEYGVCLGIEDLLLLLNFAYDEVQVDCAHRFADEVQLL